METINLSLKKLLLRILVEDRILKSVHIWAFTYLMNHQVIRHLDR